MSTVSRGPRRSNASYPTSDGRPIAETDPHRLLMTDLIQTLTLHFAADPNVYISGNLLMFYVPGDKSRHLSPDVFMVRGVPKRERLNYLTWEEGKGPDVVIELTSASTRDEDVKDKFRLYQDKLKVPEFFLFDPLGEYLDPQLRGHRLRRGKYATIARVRGRLPGQVLGLHFEQVGNKLRLYDPIGGRLLPTTEERIEQAEAATREAKEETARSAAEIDRLQREIAELRRRVDG